MALLLITVALGSAAVGLKLGTRYQINSECCSIPLSRSVILSVKEKLGLTRFHAGLGEDKWVTEAVFPGVRNGFFLDVGAGDGTLWSKTKALEEKGWRGICVDPFPQNMQDRTCQVFREVVFSEAGKQVKFWNGGQGDKNGFWGGIIDTLGYQAKAIMSTAPSVELTTVTLGDILERAKAPRFIHFVVLDIEGGELNALKGFPFDKYKIGALAVEHFSVEPRRSEIGKLMESHGYKRVFTRYQNDYYVPANP